MSLDRLCINCSYGHTRLDTRLVSLYWISQYTLWLTLYMQTLTIRNRLFHNQILTLNLYRPNCSVVWQEAVRKKAPSGDVWVYFSDSFSLQSLFSRPTAMSFHSIPLSSSLLARRRLPQLLLLTLALMSTCQLPYVAAGELTRSSATNHECETLWIFYCSLGWGVIGRGRLDSFSCLFVHTNIFWLTHLT